MTILDIIKKIFRHKPMAETHSKPGEDLTRWEVRQIVVDPDNLSCPDCRHNLWAGPEAGIAQNFACMNCGARFSIWLIGDQNGLVGQRCEPLSDDEIAASIAGVRTW
jgi:hypothetical protein